jgi:late embryogenesis abundant protein
MNGLSVLVVLAGAAGLYFWNLARAAGNLIYFPGNITGFRLDGISPVFYVDLIIQNTNNVSFTINSLAGNVLSNSTVIGNIANFTPIEVAGNSQTAVPLTLVLQPIAIVGDLIAIITGGVGKRDIQVHGTVNANGIQEGFDLIYNIGN